MDDWVIYTFCLTCRDVLYVNMFAMGMSLFHENFWWTLVVIPIFGKA